MSALVDAIRAEVRGDGRAWPFELDCRDDVATIELGADVYHVRPLSWREKRNLARYARLGEEFVGRHFLKMCLVKDAPLPTDPDEFEALQALARWINAPGDVGSGLPLDSGLLASVTLAVARDTGARLADLEGQTADFVEQLWQSRPHHRAEPQRPAEVRGEWSVDPLDRVIPMAPVLPDPGDMNRIVILPDPRPEASDVEPTSAAPPVLEAANGVKRPDAAEPTLPVLARSPTSVRADAPRAAAEDGPAPVAATPRSRFRVRFAEADQARGVPLNSSSSPDPAVPHPMGATRSPDPSTSEDGPTSAVPSVGPMPIASPSDSGASGLGAATLASAVTVSSPVRLGAAVALGRRPPLPGFHCAETRPAWAFREDDAVADRVRSQVAEIAPLVRAEERGPVGGLSPDTEDLFDRWAERLERAAEQIGIDLEG